MQSALGRCKGWWGRGQELCFHQRNSLETGPLLLTTPLSAAEQSFQAGAFYGNRTWGVPPPAALQRGRPGAALKSPRSLLDEIPPVNRQAGPLPLFFGPSHGEADVLGLAACRLAGRGEGTGLTALLVGGGAARPNTLAPAEEELEGLKPCPRPSRRGWVRGSSQTPVIQAHAGRGDGGAGFSNKQNKRGGGLRRAGGAAEVASPGLVPTTRFACEQQQQESRCRVTIRRERAPAHARQPGLQPTGGERRESSVSENRTPRGGGRSGRGRDAPVPSRAWQQHGQRTIPA